MKSELVKILDGEVDVSSFSQDNISEYIQAKQTVDSLTKFVIDPFKEYAKNFASKKVTTDNPNETITLYDGKNQKKDLVVSAKTSTSDKKYSAKDIVTFLETTLNNAYMNNENKKQMFSVRRFDDVPCIDVSYVGELLDSWTDSVIGTNERFSLTYKGKDANTVAQEHKSRLILTKDIQNQPEGQVQDSAVFLYVAADKQKKLINKYVIAPFEKAFKESVTKNDKETLFDNRTYGSLTVQVKTVPRPDTDYAKVKGSFEKLLLQYESSNAVDNEHVFLNEDLTQPKNYVSIPHLLSKLNSFSDTTSVSYRQEVNILHAPEKAFIIAK